MDKVPIRSDGSKQHIHTGKYILTIIGTRLTAQDVYLYRLVFGACPCCLAGKTRSPSYHESRSPSALMPGHIVHVDIVPFTEMCLGGIQYHLVCCDEFSTYLQSFLKIKK
jgi:hypothetical protein